MTLLPNALWKALGWFPVAMLVAACGSGSIREPEVDAGRDGGRDGTGIERDACTGCDDAGVDAASDRDPCEGHCGNGIQDCGETGIDCGGACAACVDPCAGHCGNGTQDCGETGVDCGGDCVACADPCAGHCANEEQDCGETGPDCGGDCPACPDPCNGHCANGVQDCGETGVDCGGDCAACVDPCAGHCGNGTLDCGETGVDCGGDCVACTEPCAGHCTNGEQDCGEAGVDCGGDCSGCVGLLLEAEQFEARGGWVVDQQFIDVMGSAYLMAHGLGVPVGDAVTEATFPAPGTYRLWVRTRDWVPPHSPGTFRVVLNGTELPEVFGTEGEDWLWQDGGTVVLSGTRVSIRLRDLTGFNGRCDALYFSQDLDYAPPDDPDALRAWRRVQEGLPATPPSAGDFDLVVVGGGIAGCAAALVAARLGLHVAVIHDRPFLGGNASQEVRVGTGGNAGRYVHEINTGIKTNLPQMSPLHIEFDNRRRQVLEAESSLELFLEHRATGVLMDQDRIDCVVAVDLPTGTESCFHAPLFVDSTGDGWIGYWARAEYREGREARSQHDEPLAPVQADLMTLGSTVRWKAEDTGTASSFPDVRTWTAEVAGSLHAHEGPWYWEYGIPPEISTIYDAEHIRDHLLRATFGAFYNEKQLPGKDTWNLVWVAYVAGKRESRRLVGDYLLTQNDIADRVYFPDTVAVGDWGVDLHYTDPCRPCTCDCSNCNNINDGETPCDACSGEASCAVDFISRADIVHRSKYYIPYRILYSANVPNLFMAGRDVSVTHAALGGVRVMNTCGQMGVAVGAAAYLCNRYETTPRGIYQDYLDPLVEIVRSSDDIVFDSADGTAVQTSGAWTVSDWACDDQGPGTCYGPDYLHDDNESSDVPKTVRFTPELTAYRGRYTVAMRWPGGSNRATNVPVDVVHLAGTDRVLVNQRAADAEWVALGTYPLLRDAPGSVVVSNQGTDGYVVVDALRFHPAEILVDNADPEGVQLTGTWTASTYNCTQQPFDCHDHDYLVDDGQGQGARSVRFTPRLPYFTTWAVYLWWTAGAGRADNVPVDIVHAHGTETVLVNQQASGGRWVLLGVFPFRKGEGGSVRVRNDDANGYVVADAVRFSPVMLLDNGDGHGLRTIGSWQSSTSSQQMHWGPDYAHDRATGKGSKSVRFTPLMPYAGTSEVYLLWTASSNRSHNVPVVVNHAGGSQTHIVDQQQNGGRWMKLGEYDFAAGTAGNLTVNNQGTTEGTYVVVDAVMFTYPR